MLNDFFPPRQSRFLFLKMIFNDRPNNASYFSLRDAVLSPTFVVCIKSLNVNFFTRFSHIYVTWRLATVLRDCSPECFTNASISLIFSLKKHTWTIEICNIKLCLINNFRMRKNLVLYNRFVLNLGCLAATTCEGCLRFFTSINNNQLSFHMSMWLITCGEICPFWRICIIRHLFTDNVISNMAPIIFNPSTLSKVYLR